jgi:hypothetical protein
VGQQHPRVPPVPGHLLRPDAVAGRHAEHLRHPDGGGQTFELIVSDDLLNPLVGGSAITVEANAGTVIGGDITVPDGESFNQLVDGLTRFHFTLLDDAPGEGETDTPISITVTIESENGDTSAIVASGVIRAAAVMP